MTTPIKHAYYILNGLKEKFFPITVEEAVYDPTGGGNLKNKLATLSENFSDAFDPEKSYTIGDICIYLNRLYRFTSAKEPGEFDGTKVIPISVSEIMRDVSILKKYLGSAVLISSELPDVSMTNSCFIRTDLNQPGGLPSWFMGVYICWGRDAVIIGVGITNKTIYIASRNNGSWSSPRTV